VAKVSSRDAQTNQEMESVDGIQDKACGIYTWALLPFAWIEWLQQVVISYPVPTVNAHNLRDPPNGGGCFVAENIQAYMLNTETVESMIVE